jgi:hypothetical protein
MIRRPRRAGIGTVLLAAILGAASPARAQAPDTTAPMLAPGGFTECNFSAFRQAVWWGKKRSMTLRELASYVAPVYWFSPDEPLLNEAQGRAIRIPEPLPFEAASPDSPVVYFQVNDVVNDGEGVTRDPANPADTRIDFEHVTGATVAFFAYFSSEVGLGAHQHDIETVEFKLIILPTQSEFVRDHTGVVCKDPGFVIAVTRVTAKAHGIIWFWNVLDTDRETNFPMHLLVEEGKHALCTDKNSDGYFTPNYDVNHYVNDAWGIRDVIRGGTLFSGAYQSWMTKIREPQYRVLPPLPGDSPLWKPFRRRLDSDPSEYATYALRPFPPADRADAGLRHFMDDKEVPNWPEVRHASGEGLRNWVNQGSVVKTLAVNFYYDGQAGLSLAFPLLVVKNVEDPIGGGFIVNRMYWKGHNLENFGWMALYTPSASRWFDTYLSSGCEWDHETVNGKDDVQANFVLETGFKLRVNLSHSPLKFLKVLTDFWGVRAGIKNYGITDIDRLTYVFEVGAGAW